MFTITEKSCDVNKKIKFLKNFEAIFHEILIDFKTMVAGKKCPLYLAKKVHNIALTPEKYYDKISLVTIEKSRDKARFSQHCFANTQPK